MCFELSAKMEEIDFSKAYFAIKAQEVNVVKE